MLPYWQENLRVQMLRNYQHQHKGTAESLSQCWANKWFFGCSYPKRVHDIIDQWPAPRKEDVDDSIKLPNYVDILPPASMLNDSSDPIPSTTTTNSLLPPATHHNVTQRTQPLADRNANLLPQHTMDNENEDIDLQRIHPTHDALEPVRPPPPNAASTIGQKRKRNELNANEHTQPLPSTKKLKTSATPNNVDNTLQIAHALTHSNNANAETASIDADSVNCIKSTKSKRKKSKRPRWG